MMIVNLMDKYGVYRTLLSTNFQLRDKEIMRLAKRHPGRIIPTVRLSGKPQSKWDKDVASGLYGRMGEILIYHAAKGAPSANKSSNINVPEIRRSMNDPLVKASLAHAKKQGWPFTVHIEFGALSRSDRLSYKKELAKFLIDNRDVALVLIHLAQLSAEEAEPLLAEHPNLHLMTSHCNPVFLQQMPGITPNENMFSLNSLSSAWTKLVLRFPDRFVFALDNVYKEQWYWYGDQMRLWRLALEKLPPEVAHAVAHGNAERLWRLPPKTGSSGVGP